ncbi:MAG: hypothetical protein C3F19_14330 [Rhodocyclales bacterium]|jgi:PAS domain S-box-containing protein|nr:MAG: hypothetical protein C3F19_14330 [Rhodocyclales bacterium]
MPIRLHASLRGRLILVLTALFAVLFGALQLQHAEAQRMARRAALDRALDMARVYSHHYERLLHDQLTMLETLFMLHDVSLSNRSRCDNDIRRLIVSTSSLVNLAVLDSQGRVHCGILDALPGEAETRTAHLALERRSPMLGMSGTDGAPRPYVTLAHPLGEAGGEPRAVILAYIDRSWLNARFADAVPEGVVLRIFDGDGIFVVRQPKPECCVGKSGRELGGIGEAIAGGGAQIRQSTWLDGVVRLQADLPLKAPFSGVVSVGIPEALALADAEKANTRLSILLAVLLLSLYALSGFLSERSLLRPLKLLSDGTRRLRNGDLAWRIADRACKGEFADLARDFNEMADTLEANRHEIEQDMEQLRLASQVFEQAREAIIVTDTEANIVAVNPRFTEITGYGAEEVLGKNPRLLRSDRQDAAFYGEMWAALQKQGHWSGEIWNRRKDGSIYPEWLSISAVYGDAGRVANYLAVFIDLTKRKAAEEALRTSETRLATLIAFLPDAVLFKDGEGRWLVANDVARRLFSLDGTPWQGKNDVELAVLNSRFSGEHMDCWRSDEAVWAAGSLMHSLEIIYTESGVRTYDVAKMPLYDEAGRRHALVVVGRDVTDLRRNAEELERRVAERTHELQTANRELEAFSYSVSHDLRAPLRAINGFSRLLEEEYAASLDAKARNYLGRVRAGSLKMGELIDDLLELSRVSRHAMKREQADLSALATEIAAELEAGEPDRRVDWSIAPGIVVRCDIGLMRSALLNLLGNAWKYTSRREHARIEFGLEEQNGRNVYFIRDDGIGFDMRFATKLFGAFQRLHAPADFPGTGIGLATVARIIHRHGGEVWADSAPGQGATFRFTLPK